MPAGKPKVRKMKQAKKRQDRKDKKQKRKAGVEKKAGAPTAAHPHPYTEKRKAKMDEESDSDEDIEEVLATEDANNTVMGDAAPTAVTPDGEALGKMKARHRMEWLKVKDQLKQLKAKRSKLNKHSPESRQQRKDIDEQLKKIQNDYQKHVADDMATLKATGVAPEDTKDKKQKKNKKASLSANTPDLNQKLQAMVEEITQLKQVVTSQQQVIQTLVPGTTVATVPAAATTEPTPMN